MKKRRSILDYLSEKSDDPEALPVLPILELAGGNRVLVENHLGVVYYSGEVVGIQVKYGTLRICGCGLLLRHMTKTKLVVTGRIDQIVLIRKEKS